MLALDAALQLLHKAATCLERHAVPTPKDAEEALSYAQDASKILKASCNLMEEGLFSIAPEPEASTHLPFDPLAEDGGEE